MRSRLIIILTIVLVLALFILLNAASYVAPKEKVESELTPDRSTYNAGATGTRALYDLLNEAGYHAMRWREPVAALFSAPGADVTTFVMVGRTQVPIEKDEVTKLLRWVEDGGRLVIIDRDPPPSLLPRSGEWMIYTAQQEVAYTNPDPADPQQMTEGVATLHPNQTTLLTREVNTVKPSRFASVIRFSRTNHDAAGQTAPKVVIQSEGGYGPPPPKSAFPNKTNAVLITSPAPVVQLSGANGPLLVDYPHGRGRVVVLSDPYPISNGGIKLEDNLQLGLNLIVADTGVIAFDEYHQGHGNTHNALVAYFAGTPVLPIFGQLVLIVLVILWTRGRRFGRPLPLVTVDRRSSLEFVASMAELQQRARALDLAIENIYSRTRRALQRYAGVDYHSSRAEIATRVAARSSLERAPLESLMRSCEEAINGGAISERQSLELVGRLRAVEGALGLQTRSRDLKQAGK
jgi:hypothetical protein